MKVFEIRNTFGLDSLVLTERPDRTPGYGQVLIKIRAASLNYRDLLVVKGLYNPKQALPFIPLSDGVGEIVAVGEGVTRVKKGDRVAGIFAQKWLAGEPNRETMLLSQLGSPLDGMLAEYVVLHSDGVVKVPEHLTDEEAATLPVAAVTAWQALIADGHLKAGDTVLVQGTGGVSLFALQFAKMMGAKVLVISSSDEKLERTRKMGADEGINYKLTPDWDKRVLELTDNIGVDNIIEVGGASTLSQSLRAVRIGGQISQIGLLGGVKTEIDIMELLVKKARIQPLSVGPRETFEAMNRAIAHYQMRPVVDRIFPFPDAREALAYMESGAHFGKISIRF